MDSTTQRRPRESMVIARGWTMSGSPAKRETRNPSATVMRWAASLTGKGLGGSLGSAAKPGRSDPKVAKRADTAFRSGADMVVTCNHGETILQREADEPVRLAGLHTRCLARA